MPAREYTSGRRAKVLDTGSPAASPAGLQGSTKNTEKIGISGLYSPQLSWLLPRSPLNIGKEKKKKQPQIITETNCRALASSSPGTPVSWETGLVYGGGGDLSTFNYKQTWQFPTQGSSELTYAEYPIPQGQSYLWVLSPKTKGRG